MNDPNATFRQTKDLVAGLAVTLGGSYGAYQGVVQSNDGMLGVCLFMAVAGAGAIIYRLRSAP